jgi:two-component system response regulator DesR
VSVAVTARVILVEDNAVYRSSLELLLGMQNEIEVVAAVATGAEALTAVADLRPDVVVMDMRLPDIGGVELAAALRDVDPPAAIVCLTAEATPEERTAVIEAGAFVVVEKGGPIDGLVDVVTRASAR